MYAAIFSLPTTYNSLSYVLLRVTCYKYKVAMRCGKWRRRLVLAERPTRSGHRVVKADFSRLRSREIERMDNCGWRCGG
jgi:hypothetical protein